MSRLLLLALHSPFFAGTDPDITRFIAFVCHDVTCLFQLFVSTCTRTTGTAALLYLYTLYSKLL